MSKMNVKRSSDYRRRFIEADPGPWRCRYCGKRLRDKSEMTVDHVIPVARVSRLGVSGFFWRNFAIHEGIDDINDLKNLVPACRRCNSRKGQKGGIWILRAILGKYPIWFAVRTCLYLALAAALVALLVWFLQSPEANYRSMVRLVEDAMSFLYAVWMS